MIDLHSHLIPGVDDGAENLEQTRGALRLMQAQGVRAVVATPHFKGSMTARPDLMDAHFERIDTQWAMAKEMATSEFPDLRVERGVEVMLDSPTPNLSDSRLRLGGGSYVLLEFPFMAVPPQGTQALSRLRAGGVMPILAHPERYGNVTKIELADEWRSAGSLLQVNCGSLLGRYGPTAERHAWALIERGWVDLLASDYHGRGGLHVEKCRMALLERGGELQQELLMETNPSLILAGEETEAVPPLAMKRSFWNRLRGRR